MDSKQVIGMMEAYASIYEKKEVKEDFPNVKPSNRAGDAGSSGLKLIDTGSGTGYVNKHSGGNVIPPASVNKIMGGNLMVKGGKKSPKKEMQVAHYDSLMSDAYASIYEKKGDCVDKKDKGAHNCAKKVCSEQWGEGETIFGQHAVPDENGFVSHYDVQFEHGIVENVSVEDMEVLTMEGHYKEGHRYEGEQLDEMGGMMGALKKVGKAVLGPADQSPEAEAARMGKRRPQTPQEKGVAAGTVNKEDVDLFDIIKGHLIDEGFAETEEAAHSIMANMSEGWKQSIVEQSSSLGPSPGTPGGPARNVAIVGPTKLSIDGIPGVRGLRIAASNYRKDQDSKLYGGKTQQVGRHKGLHRLANYKTTSGTIIGPTTKFTDKSGDK